MRCERAWADFSPKSRGGVFRGLRVNNPLGSLTSRACFASVPSMRRALPWLISPFVALLVGCGPIEYIGQVTRRASTEVEAARVAGADKYAPYEYTLAIEYLHKAREEAGYSDYQAA